MTGTVPAAQNTGVDMTERSTTRAWAWGGMIFAATIMLIVGIFQIFEGIAAIAQDNFFVLSNTNYAYDIDTTAWGWIHLGIGVVVALTGLFLFTGATLARILGIAIAVVSAVANFFFLPYYPVWSLLIIALDVFVIWAIAHASPRELAAYEEQQMAATGAYSGERMQYGERWPSTNPPGGRHYAGEPSKESAAAEQAAQRQAAEAMARSGQQPPPPPDTPQR